MAFEPEELVSHPRTKTHGSGPSVGICRVFLVLPALTLIAALGGCGLMPVSGPATMDILSGQRDPMSLNYAIVKLTPKVIEVLSRNLRA